jgi:hypothetical protein
MMSKTEHIARMILGFILYHTIMRLPTGWWMPPNGMMQWALPLFGYYAYHPDHLKWHEPLLREHND